MPRTTLHRLMCGIEYKAWGKVGQDSLVAKLAKDAAPDVQIVDDKPYAELWMGTYPSNPSRAFFTQQPLEELIQENREVSSPLLQSKYGSRLPFLLKVLSIARPLSIQAHPNKRLAERLHASQPSLYPDNNHKPEMVIALNDFEGLCGLRPLSEVVHFLKSVPALRLLVGEDATQRCLDAAEDGSEESKIRQTMVIRTTFEILLRSEETSVNSAAAVLVAEAERECKVFGAGGVLSNPGATLSELILRLNKHFPGDVGIFTIFFLKYIRLSPGEAIYLKADTIHAHLSGDIIECMAASDNVLRAGLTPNYKDIDTFVEVLDSAAVEDFAVVPTDFDRVIRIDSSKRPRSSIKLYNPPAAEFRVVRSVLESPGGAAIFHPFDSPCLIICTGGTGRVITEGRGEVMREGSVYLLNARTSVAFSTHEYDYDDFVIFIAFCQEED